MSTPPMIGSPPGSSRNGWTFRVGGVRVDIPPLRQLAVPLLMVLILAMMLVPLPPFLAEDGTVHVSRPHPRGASVRPEITSHARLVPAADVTALHGIRLTSLERSWADLAALLRPGMLEPVVAAGDALIHRPWSPEGRRSPRTTTAALRSALLRAGRFKGVRTARAALELVRVGADSPQETALRLALLHAGLPEPERFDHVAFKGGSSVGTLALAYLLGDGDAAWTVVVQAAAGDAADLERQSAYAGLAADAAALIADGSRG